jgi:hypothetical protein
MNSKYLWPQDGLLRIASAALLNLYISTKEKNCAESASALFFHESLGKERRGYKEILCTDCILTRMIARALKTYTPNDEMESISCETLGNHLALLFTSTPKMSPEELKDLVKKITEIALRDE